MSIHMAHPSIRMKGTETDWISVHCMDSSCTHSLKGLHLHCPFCSKNVIFTDQVILKAHYRVKHCDKAIDFAGLKILRCCGTCDLHGIIHERKHFKGAHWHCYHCHNGFNRRDEAVKHFKQHFRNPQTTLQIVIAQDVNQMNGGTPTQNNQALTSASLQQHMMVSQPIEARLAEAGTGYGNAGVDQKSGSEVKYQFVGTTDHTHSNEISENGEETIVLIEIQSQNPDSKDDVTQEVCYADHGTINLGLLQEKERLERQLEEEMRRSAQMEIRMKGTIERLRAKVEYLSTTNAALKHQLTTLHTSSLRRLINDTDHHAILDELVQHMSEDHTQLLHHHLAQLRLYAQAVQHLSGSAADSADQSQNIIMMASPPTDAVVMTVSSEESRTLDDVTEQDQDDNTTMSLPNDVQIISDDGQITSNNVQIMSSGNHMMSSGDHLLPNGVQIACNDVQMMSDDIQMTADSDDQMARNYQMASGGVQVMSGGESYQLSAGEFSENGNTGESHPSGISHPPHKDGNHPPPNFNKDKTLKLILPDGTSTIFSSLEKRTFERDVSSEEPLLKRCRATKVITAS